MVRKLMTPDDSFAGLIRRLEAGDPEAAAVVFDRYVRRLIGLARRQLDARLRTKVDEEDVAQSVFRSFFRRQAADPFDIASEDALWALLAEITMRKCGRWNRHFLAGKRSVGREAPPPAPDDSIVDEPIDAGEPSPADVAILAETVEELLRGLDERERLICEMRLHGYQVQEIAARAGCTERTVLRKLKHVKSRLERLCPPGT
jgi:RNA polymerase sigma-70 factor (ECF subfamily)